MWHVEATHQYQQQDTGSQDIDYPNRQYCSGQWYGSASITPSNIAPAAKPLPPNLQIEYTDSEGLVSAPERLCLSA
jgi:hypothetical protein